MVGQDTHGVAEHTATASWDMDHAGVSFADGVHPETADRPLLALALAFLGIGTITAEVLSETASWDRTGAPSTVGRDQILTQLASLSAPEQLCITQIVSEGKAGTVSGRLQRKDRGSALFCLVLRFTAPARSVLAQVVSFEQAELT